MPITLFNSIASWLLKKRYHQIELFLKYPEEVQDEVLHQLLSFAEDTEIGRKYDFESIASYETFAERVPIVSYEEVEPMIERSRKGEQNIFWPTTIKWFAKSSGTTNAKSKFIPVSSEALEDCHYKSSKDLLCLYLNNNENSQLFTGKSLRLGGSKELYQDNGTVFGDLSAILIDNMPFWAELSSTPSNKVSLMSEWETKLQAIIKESVQENVTSLAGVPSWMLVLLNNVLEQTGKEHLFSVWENLEVLRHHEDRGPSKFCDRNLSQSHDPGKRPRFYLCVHCKSVCKQHFHNPPNVYRYRPRRKLCNLVILRPF